MLIELNEAPKNGLPDLDEFFKKLAPNFKKKSADPFEPKKSNLRWWIVTAVILLLVLIGFSSMVTVKPTENLVITRFGAYYKTDGAGLHWTIPIVDQRTIIDLSQVQTIAYEGQVLTMDGDLVNVSATMAYQIEDPKAYLFFGNVSGALQSVLSQAVTTTILQNNFADLLNNGNWKQLGTTVTSNVADLSSFGVKVTGVELQNIAVPPPLSESFNTVIANAQDQVKQLLADANTFAETLQPLAAQKASGSLAYADAEKFATMLNATRDAAEFNSFVPAYQADAAATLAYLPLLIENDWHNLQAIAGADGASPSDNQAAYLRWRTAANQSASEAQNEAN